MARKIKRNVKSSAVKTSKSNLQLSPPIEYALVCVLIIFFAMLGILAKRYL